MSEQELNKLIAENISRLLENQGKTQTDLAEYMDVSQATVSNWCKGVKAPRMSKIDKICGFFNVKRSEILGDMTDKYYTDQDAAELAQELLENPDMRVLFDAAKDSTSKDLQMAADLLKRFKSTNPDG